MRTLLAMVLLTPLLVQADLIVVEDLGGASALPYYQALNLIPQSDNNPLESLPQLPLKQYGEEDMLPVRSVLLTPGMVEARALAAQGLQPLFLIGDDARSRAWLIQRGDALRELNAVGLVVNVENLAALHDLRQLAQGLALAPAAGDQLAEMVGIEHYPVLITATGLEQ